ncbi:MAG: hypothetical protein HY074_15390 [Deltaproteobacteria bacterium]|nr:hypothetical protein [Deltaproteobacteria bacterium]
MKTLIISIAIVLISAHSHAVTHVKLAMDLAINGKSSRPNVVTSFGKAAVLTQVEKSGNGYEISVLPNKTTIDGKEAVKLDFIVSKFEGGIKTRISKPQAIALLGQEARVSQESKEGSLDLRVVPTLQ